MKFGFVSDGAERLEKALRQGVRKEVVARYSEALEKAKKAGGVLDMRLQIECEIEDELRRRRPSSQALFIS
mgnify:CR=1 FL=1